MKKILAVLFISVSLAMVSCKGWLDVNHNPNAVEEIDPKLVLPQAELSFAVTYGGVLHNQGSVFVQYYDQGIGSPNIREYTKYNLSSTHSSRAYDDIYSLSLINAEYVRTECAKDEDWGNFMAATVLKAYAYQALVDCFGETPYSQALKGADVPYPTYDAGQDVYNGILAELDDALGKVGSNLVTDKNLLFGKNSTAKWISFGKALKLKLLMRQSNVNESGVKAKILALVEEGDFPTGDVAYTCWADEPAKGNPFYEDAGRFFGGNDHMATHAYITSMTGDPRMPKQFKKSPTNNDYKGGVAGNVYSATGAKNTFSYPIYDPVAPVYMFTQVELELFLAEIEFRWGSKADAQAHYEAAIDASFAMWDAGDASAFYGAGGAYEWNDADGMKLIAIQKWLSLYGVNGFESWCEVRRLKYPEFSVALGAAIVADVSLYTPYTLISPVDVPSTVGPRTMITRMFYADSSKSKNANAPAYKTLTTKIFWQQ